MGWISDTVAAAPWKALDWNLHSASYLTYSLLGLLALLVSIHYLTPKDDTAPHGASTRIVPRVPYLLPVLGHIPNVIWNADEFFQSQRRRYTQGIFAVHFAGSTHNVTHSPGLTTALLKAPSDKADFSHVARSIMTRVFGFPRADFDTYARAEEELSACYRCLLTEPGLGGMVERTAKQVQTNVVDLVTGMSSPVDQTAWEKSGGVEMVPGPDGQLVAEASLEPLVRDFCAHCASPTLMGSNFLTNFPDFFDDLWTLDRAFLLMSAGLPRWTPIPAVTRAHIARRRLLSRLRTFHTALEAHWNGADPGPEWSDLDDVGALVRARMPVYRRRGLSVRGRAVMELLLLWAANANANALVFWMLTRIYADAALLARVRAELRPVVRAARPPQAFGLPEPPRFENFDVDALCARCPLLKSCYIECLRLDAASWSLKLVKRDFVLAEPDGTGEAWALRAGEYAHAAHALHNTDPAHFPDPGEWKGERHVRADGAAADMGTIRPYGGGKTMCKGRAFAFKECMLMAAAVLAVWEVEPRGGGEWKIPAHRQATSVFGARADVRVWLRRRQDIYGEEQGG